MSLLASLAGVHSDVQRRAMSVQVERAIYWGMLSSTIAYLDQPSAQRVHSWDLILGRPVDPLLRSPAAAVIVSTEGR
jgi:hypothetical protein